MPRDAVDERPAPGGGTYRLEKVKCGKRNCTKCPHGPYWYSYTKVGNRTVSKYVGKHLPGAAPAAKPAEVTASAEVTAAPAVDGGTTDARILAVVAEFAPQPAEFTTLVSVRQRLEDVGLDRAEVDAALDRMYRAQQVNLIPYSSPRQVTDDDRQAVITVGGQDKHLIAVVRSHTADDLAAYEEQARARMAAEPGPAPAAGNQPAGIEAALRSMNSREDAYAYLDSLGLRKAGLLAAAREAGIATASPRDTVADLKRRIVEGSVGARLDVAAIRGGYREQEARAAEPGNSGARAAGASAAGQENLDQRVRQALRDLTGPGDRPPHYVSLTRLRAHLADVPRADLDAALQELARQPGFGLEREMNQKSLTEADRAAALEMGLEPRHLLAFDARPAAAAPPQHGRRPGPGAPTAPAPGLRERLDAMSTRQEAREYLDGLDLKKAGLAAAARELGVGFTSRETAAGLRQRIIESTVGARADAAAIRGGVQGASGQPADAAIAAPPGGRRRQRAAAGPVSGRHLDRPLLPNNWGRFGHVSDAVNYHADGAIGTAIGQMGADARLDVDGEPLADVLGKAATDAVTGRATAQQLLARVKALRARLPEGATARRALDDAIERMDAPDTPVPQVPAATLAPLRQLMADLHAVPLVRRDPEEETRLLGLCEGYAAGRTGGARLLMGVRALRNLRHESKEGKFEVDRAVDTALAALEELQREHGRKALFLPAPEL